MLRGIFFGLQVRWEKCLKMYNDNIFTIDTCKSLGETWILCNIILFDRLHSISWLAPSGGGRVNYTDRRFFSSASMQCGRCAVETSGFSDRKCDILGVTLESKSVSDVTIDKTIFFLQRISTLEYIIRLAF